MPYVYLDIDSVFFEESRKIYSFFLLKGGGGGGHKREIFLWISDSPSLIPSSGQWNALYRNGCVKKVINNFLKEGLFNIFGRPMVVLGMDGFEVQNSKE